ncbi:calcium-translocating P-type ATPase, SERCA-type [Candidatus Woesearchaeota archaeon]|nr:calcium-translocating P-type ATPase, SERCA-type [Candidatus Woesearchaeota archaeon]
MSLNLYYNMPSKEVIEHFASSEEKGLTSKEVEFRLKKFGKNKLTAKKKETILHRFINQFKELMIIILIIAGIIALVLGLVEHSTEEMIDAGIILFIVLANAVIGVLQEYKAEKAVEALKKMMTPHATVIRDDKEEIINAEDLVPGDILILEEGTRVPSDARVIEVAMLKVDEAVLTGESVPRSKNELVIKTEHVALGDRHNMLFMGTNITSGRAKAIVTASGMTTEFGKIAGLTADIKEEKSPLQKELIRVGKFIAKAALVICVVVFILGILSGKELVDMFLFAVSLGVAAVPEGLPATMTISLALGVQRMAKRKAIMRKLSSVETLGSTTVICTDKTGTLTKNEMTVRKIWVNNKTIDVQGEGYDPKGSFLYSNKPYSETTLTKLLRTGLLCNNAVLQKDEANKWAIVGDPTEGALVVSAVKAGINEQQEEKDYARVFELPFSSDAKRMITMHKDKEGKGLTAYIKGATAVVIDKCSYIEVDGKIKKLSAKQKEEIKVISRQMAEQALRVLGFAYKKLQGIEAKNYKKVKEEGFVFLGLQGMIDPPRLEVKEAVAKCRKAGIRIFVVTGDHGLTARAIAKEIGLATDKTRIIKGVELEKMNDQALSLALREEVIFARVSPEHKMRIASLLMKHQEIVAMTGDGVNDAPALKKADIGVAMGITGTDVSKEASEMVLTDDSFATIVNAVEEGRSIYSNITKFIRYMFSTNLGEIIAIVLGMLILSLHPLYHHALTFLEQEGFILIVTAVQILWINLGTDLLPALALGVEPPEQGIMNKPPRNPKEKIINTSRFLHWLMTGMVIGVGTIMMFMTNMAEPVKARTMAFSVLVFFQLANVFNCRHETKSIFELKPFSNKYIIYAVIVSIILQVMVIQVPFLQTLFKTTALGLKEWGAVVLLSLIIIVYDEIRKAFARRHTHRSAHS